MKIVQKLKFLSLLLIFLGGIFLTLPVETLAQDLPSAVNVEGVIGGLDSIAKKSGLENQNVSLADRVGKIIGFLLIGLGALFLGLAIFAGIQWMLARDNEENVKKSKDLLRDAAVGLAVVLAAFLLARFVSTSVFKAIQSDSVSGGNSGQASSEAESSLSCVSPFFCAESCYSDATAVVPVPNRDGGCAKLGMPDKVCCLEVIP